MNVKELIKTLEGNLVSIASLSKEGKPYVTMFDKVKVQNGQILIGNISSDKSVKNILENSKVSLVVCDSNKKGYEIEGFCDYLTEGDEFNHMKSLNENYKGVFVIIPITTEEVQWQM